MRNVLLSIAVSSLVVGSGTGQTVSTVPATAASRELTREQIAERLARFKEDIAAKVISEKDASDRNQSRKWYGKFQAVVSDHYIVFTNGPTTTCKKFARELEALYARVQKEWPFEDIDRLLVCYIFKEKDEYTRFCVKFTGWDEEQAARTAGHANGAYYATYYQSPKAAVVRHEATHQIVHACLKTPGVGSWFQEGTATYIEKLTSGEDPGTYMRMRFKNDDYYALEEFVALKSLLFDPKKLGSRNYEQAGALIDFLCRTKQEPIAGRFNDFLREARRSGHGRNAATASKLFETVYGLSLAEVEKLWKKEHGVKS